MLQMQRQRAVAAHRVTGDSLPCQIRRREAFGNDLLQLVRDVLIHAVMLRPRLVRGREIEARALSQVVSRIVGNLVAARRSVGCDHHEAKRSSGALQTRLGHHVLPRARQARQAPQHRNALRLRLRRRKHREAHVAIARLRGMLEDGQRSIKTAPAVLLRQHYLSTPLALAV
jgi:hypothetical protein